MKHVEQTGILDMLAQYAAKKPVRMHMPGHKADARFCKLFSKVASLDITELAFSDNLANPVGVIREAEQRAAEIFGAKRTFFLTDGSTCGVFSMLSAVRRYGKKIIISRNAHKSVYNACRLLGIEPIVLGQNFMEGVCLPPQADDVARALERTEGVIGLLVTYPDYYGNIADLSAYKQVLSEKGKLLLVDGAHGAHLRFDGQVPYAGEYADLWVDGVHKTMPALSQAALLHVGNETLLWDAERAVCALRTSSPNYVILASIEYAVSYMNLVGTDRLGALRREFSLSAVRMRKKGIAFYPSKDALKIVVDCEKTGIDPTLCEKELEKKGVYLEMNDGRYLLFLLSPVMGAKEIKTVEKLLIKLRRKKALRKTSAQGGTIVPKAVRRLPYLVAVDLERERVPLDQAVGRIAADNVGTFPPCFPIVVAGEVFTEDVVKRLKEAKDTFGVYDGCVECCK